VGLSIRNVRASFLFSMHPVATPASLRGLPMSRRRAPDILAGRYGQPGRYRHEDDHGLWRHCWRHSRLAGIRRRHGP
jgi:hypothetical protein